jgi:cytidylate kinase
VALGVAERLGYECVSREVLLQASNQFEIPEIELENAIKDAPPNIPILGWFTADKQPEYIAYFQSALTRRLCHDNVVYHGLAGHVLLSDLPHLLKVRIMADLDLRASVVMERRNLSRADALAAITKVDKARMRWTKKLYGVDPQDASLYDLVLNMPRFEVEDAVELICRSLQMKQFESTPEAQRQMEDLALACEVKAALVDKHPQLSVVSNYGNVLIYGASDDRHVSRIQADLEEIRETIKGINNIEIHADVPAPAAAV